MSPFRLAVLTCLFPALAAAVPVVIPIPDGDFEQQAAGWRFGAVSMGEIVTEQAASGRYSLKIVDTDNQQGGSDVYAPRVPIPGLGVYELRWKTFPVSGGGCGIYVRVLDAAGQLVYKGDQFHRGAPDSPKGQWVDARLPITIDREDAAFFELWVHSYSHATCELYLDDFEYRKLSGADPVPPPWTPQYKLRPTDQLTAADVVGPDGLVYPNWTRAGVPGGIPDVPVVTRLRDHGGLPDDDQDDIPALVAAIEAAAAAGGGAILLEAGTYHLDRPIGIRHDGVVIRGAGRDQTKVMFRYHLGDDGIRFASPVTHNLIYSDTTVTLHALPTNLRKLEIFANGVSIATRSHSTHWGNTFSHSTRGHLVRRQTQAGDTAVTLRGVATYLDGSTREVEQVFALADGSDPEEFRRSSTEIAIAFTGRGAHWQYEKIKLAADGLRGQTQLTLEKTDGLSAGDWIGIEGPATERWKTLTMNECQWGTYRRNIAKINRIEGNVVHLDEPLRIEFPVIDGSQVWRMEPITGCGIEDLTIEQTENLWITTVRFDFAQGCWARGVKVIKCGRFPIYGYEAEQCTVADCIFEGAWFNGGGGTAYAGWEHCYDCLQTDCETTDLRHAPCVQWAASGNVIRRGRYLNSDMQWHSGWTNENLMEQCEVVATRGTGSYGYGAWASPPEDVAHGPNGPRNVVYNCDLTSPATGLWMGGMNEAWMILHNRFQVTSGNGVYARTFSFDHIIKGNVFRLGDANHAAFYLASPDVTGVELIDNVVFGGAPQLLSGLGQVAVQQGNVQLPLRDEAPRPQPAVPSIYEWQMEHCR